MLLSPHPSPPILVSLPALHRATHGEARVGLAWLGSQLVPLSPLGLCPPGTSRAWTLGDQGSHMRWKLRGATGVPGDWGRGYLPLMGGTNGNPGHHHKEEGENGGVNKTLTLKSRRSARIWGPI